MTDSRLNVVWASGGSDYGPVSERAVRHGIECEPLVIENLSRAFGVQLFPATETKDIFLTPEIILRARPDAVGGKDNDVIVEIKCPWSKGRRGQIGQRMELHARQVCMELLAFPTAKCLIFAAVAIKPGRDKGYDSALRRLDRACALDALTEMQEQGVLNDFAYMTAKHERAARGASQENIQKVTAILDRMVAKAVDLPKLSKFKLKIALALLPELFTHVPTCIAHDIRRDDEVASDCMLLHSPSTTPGTDNEDTLGGLCITDLPKYYLRFNGRVALYHVCLQQGVSHDILSRCCFKKSDVSSAKFMHGKILRDGNLNVSDSVQKVYRLASSLLSDGF